MIVTPFEVTLLVVVAVTVLGLLVRVAHNRWRRQSNLPKSNRLMNRQVRELRKLIDRKQGEARNSPSTWYSLHGGTRYVITRGDGFDEVEVTAPRAAYAYRIFYMLSCVAYAEEEVPQGWANTDRLSGLISCLKETVLWRAQV